MENIVTPCAFCGTPIAVGFWRYLPSKPPADIHCPKCGGRNNINRGSIGLAVATLLFFTFLGVALARTIQGAEWGVLAVPIAFAVGVWPAAFLGSRRPGLVKYARWWIRPTPTLSDADRALMDQLGVTYNGEYFIVGEMHFDHLGDAVAFARS